ncbi:MAG: polyprenyl synthetase family protein [Deltaproteobacteria bacterium]|nr:polyprenyl synthetase family protein [Deltaproteobacteria bacterium]
MNFDLTGYLEQKRTVINAALLTRISSKGDGSRLCEAMRYCLMGNGKRLRPILCIAAAEAVGGDTKSPILEDISCALEMIHTYSLIHDDLPAMDDDRLRRGRPTCHVRFDEATAILAGDALLTLAFELIPSSSADPAMPSRILSVIKMIARAAGYHGMIEGQMRDIAYEKQNINFAAVKEMHCLKTGLLIEASVVSGAIISGADEVTISCLTGYARKLGLAFQVTDDILNVEGDPAIMGKSAGTDAFRHKSAFPAMIGIDASKKYAQELIDKAIESLSVFGDRAAPLCAIAKYVLLRKR